MREPLTWPGGVRQSASGLVVEVLTDEGICGIGEAPGPTLPTIRTVIEQEFTQVLVGQDPLRTVWLVHRMEEFSRNWSGIAAYAIAGLEIALLDLKGKVLGTPVVELLGGVCSDRVPVVGYLFIDDPEANADNAAAFVAAGHTELKLKLGRDLTQDHDTVAAICRARVSPPASDG
jgi:L-alanine-DL-glutamate epimerase-like enolase superfamily enzyme